MKYSYRWLKQLSGTKKSPEALAKLLIHHAFEVEGLEKREGGLEGVLVGEVSALERHPNADKLRVATVILRRGRTERIVCGAPNIAVGQKVAVALPGTLLPGGRRIEQAEIRGTVSHGMICSGKELGISDDHSGILVLPADLSPGTIFAKHFELDDTLLDVKILPDRGSDALSYQGLAREIAALDGRAPAFVDEKPKALALPAYNRAPKIHIAAKPACRRYAGVLVKNITLGPAPLMMQIKLVHSGIKPKNNVVDLTNYLMLLTGQPLHAFDADKISGGITVRWAKKNERLTLLDGTTLKLHPEDLVIADDKRALALAGIMGGEASAVTGATTNVFLEIASFDPSVIRRTKTRHSLSTDASYRFERNLDPELPKTVAREAARLLVSVAGGRIMGFRDVVAGKWPPRTILLPLVRVSSVLGIDIPLFEAVRYLALLGLKVKKVAQEDVLRVTVDSRRPDLQDEWDLIEEIGRLYGYDGINPEAPRVALELPVHDQGKVFENEAKQAFAAAGFDEIMTYSFYGKRELEQSGLAPTGHVALANPMNPDQTYLRRSLVPNLVRKIRENSRHFKEMALFEYGSVFETTKSGPNETKKIALGLLERSRPEGDAALFLMKGRLERALTALGLAERSYHSLDRQPSAHLLSASLHATRSAEIRRGDRAIGVVGELAPHIAAGYGLPRGVIVAELAIRPLLESRTGETVFEPLPRYPFALRDISLTFPAAVTAGAIQEFLMRSGAPLLQKAELFDVFHHGTEKNMAYHLSFGLPERTLKSAEMDAVFDRLVSEAAEKFGARLAQESPKSAETEAP